MKSTFDDKAGATTEQPKDQRPIWLVKGANYLDSVSDRQYFKGIHDQFAPQIDLWGGGSNNRTINTLHTISNWEELRGRDRAVFTTVDERGFWTRHNALYDRKDSDLPREDYNRDAISIAEAARRTGTPLFVSGTIGVPLPDDPAARTKMLEDVKTGTMLDAQHIAREARVHVYVLPEHIHQILEAAPPSAIPDIEALKKMSIVIEPPPIRRRYAADAQEVATLEPPAHG